MEQDKIIEMAKEAELITEYWGCWTIQLFKQASEIAPFLTKFAELVIDNELNKPVRKFIKDETTCSIITLDNIKNGTLLYKKPHE